MWMLLATLVVFFSIGCIAAPLNWSEVPLTPPSARNLENSALGACPCDLASGHCDVDCCCDADCTADEVKLFSECIPEPSLVNARACVDSTTRAIEIFRINHADVERDDQIPGEEAICVLRSNYPDKKDVFSVVSPVAIASQVTFPTDWFAGSHSVEAGFRAGDLISLHTIDAGTGLLVLQGYLNTHTRGRAGVCSSQVPAKFMVDSQSACTLAPTLSLSELCTSLNHPWYRAIVRPNSPTTTMATVAPIGVTIIDSESNEILDAFDPTNAFQDAISGVAVSPPPNRVAILENNLCVNAPISITTTITISTYGGSYAFISSINQTVAVQNISQDDIRNGVLLRRNVVFAKETQVEPTARSGNPGFTPGSLVFSGSLLENGEQKAIALRDGGLSLPLGDCLNGSWSAVRFLYDVPDSSCHVWLSEAELEQLCVSGTKSLFDSIRNRTLEGIGTLPATNLYVAQTGDADWRTPTSWIEVTGFDFTESTPLPYSVQNGECGNVVVGMAIELVVGRAGSINNPQDIIVGARADPVYGTWKFRKAGPFRQQFRFRTTVSWSRKVQGDEATRSRRVIAPPVLPSVHEHIFFPFRRPG